MYLCLISLGLIFAVSANEAQSEKETQNANASAVSNAPKLTDPPKPTDAPKFANPVLHGINSADPEILYSEKTGKFYIYPTFTLNTFHAFSSDDLVNWKDEGPILSLENVSWEDRYPWAPCIMEKKIDGEFRYFFYFCADLKIGVAVSDSPTGPFTDSGKPLIDFKPEGAHGVEIDPDVFTDPVSGKTYIYWGNSYLGMAELNDDFVTLKKETIRRLDVPGFFEGAHVFFRHGKYYLTWSENDARSPDYRVRHAISDSPAGPFRIPEQESLILSSRPEKNIYGTGHHSVVNLPGTDEWFIVYHRHIWPRPQNPWAREVCIDRMTFRPDGQIRVVEPTHEGIAPLGK